MYKLTKSNNILRLEDGAFIPDDPSNKDYQEYLKWLTVAGNVPEPVDPDIVTIPSEVTMRQARLALLEAGKLHMVAPAIESMQSPQKEAAMIEWEYSGTVQRNKPITLSIAQALIMSPEEMDSLFIRAAQL